ncbi:MAG: hypothetical protein JHC95_00885 [Solirubrobacteraceae bacterium]|nr:hypothetical protein [Solirubrobacteraceae bacterium]
MFVSLLAVAALTAGLGWLVGLDPARIRIAAVASIWVALLLPVGYLAVVLLVLWGDSVGVVPRRVRELRHAHARGLPAGCGTAGCRPRSNVEIPGL